MAIGKSGDWPAFGEEALAQARTKANTLPAKRQMVLWHKALR